MAKNQTIVIDIVARLKDETTDNINAILSVLNNSLNSVQNSVDDLNNALSGTQANINTLNHTITTTTQSTDNLGNTANSTQNNIDDLDTSIEDTRHSATELAGGLAGAQRSTANYGNTTNRTRTNTDRFRDSMRRTEQQAQRLTRDRWLMRLDVVDRSAQSIQKVTNSIGNISNKTFSFTMKMTDLATKPLQGLVKLASNPIVAFGSIAGVSVGVKDTIDTFGNFEQTMANVHAITKSSPEDFKELKDTAMHLGETTVFSANEAAQGMTYLGMAGWKKDTIKAAMPDLLNLSSAGQTDLATTSDIVSDVMTAYGLDPTDMYNKDKGISATGHIADVFAATVTGSNTDISMLGETMKYAAPIAKQFNMSFEDTAGMAGMMANAGIKSSQAGTTLRGAMTRLAKKPKEAKEELERFNINLSDETTGDIKPITDIVTDLSDAFSHLTQEEKLSSASKIFGVNAVSGWLAVLDQGPDKLKEFTKSIREADGAAKEMADIQLDTLQGSFKLLQSAAEGVKIRVGDRLAPTLRRFTDFITANMPSIERVVSSVVGNIDRSLNTLESNIHNLTDSFEWKNADSFSDKFTLAWDKVIAEPFQSWWSSSGQSFMADVANKVGSGLGGLYKGLAGLVFGFEDDDSSAVSIGKSFADGFIEGFDVETTAKRVMNGIGNIFSHSHFNIFADKEDKSIVSTLMAGFMINKGLQLTSSIAGGVSTGSRVLGGLIRGTPATATVGAGLGGAGLPSSTVVAGAGASSLLMPAALIGSFASATGGIVSAAGDFKDAANTENKKLKRDSTYKGVAKTGLVAGGAGLGATIGTFLLPGLGTGAGALLGAGIGGLGALFKGNDLGQFISDVSDSTAEIDKMTESFKEAREQADKMSFKNLKVDNLISDYNNLEKKIKDGNLSVEQRVRLEDEQKSIIQALSEMYPDIISYYDIQNGKFADALNSIKELSSLDKDIAELELKNKAIEATSAIPELTDRVLASQKEQEDIVHQKEQFDVKMPIYQASFDELEKLKKEYNLAITKYEPNSNEVSTAKMNLDNKMLEIQNIAMGFGDVLSANSVDQLQGQLKSYNDDYRKLNESLIVSKNQQKENEGKLGEAQRTIIQDISNMYGFYEGLDEAAKNFDKMNKEQQDSFLKAKMQVQDFIKGLDYVPKDVYTYVHLIGDNMSLSMVDTTYNFVASQFPTTIGYNPNKDKAIEATSKVADSMVSRTKGFKELRQDNISRKATGGILTKPQYVLVAEAGPEAIIPLSGANRERGRELWQQAGYSLGMFEEQKEIPTAYIGESRFDFLSSEEAPQTNATPSISITLGGVNITINGSGNLNDGNAIVKIIREHMPEIADELCEEIAAGLKKAFDNMPISCS